MTDTVLVSQIDRSINVASPASDGGFFESRFVSRKDDTVIVYLSSQSGCDLSCRMCHLTQTKQSFTKNASVADYLKQAKRVFAEAVKDSRYDVSLIRHVHYNFMARGDALANPNLVTKFKDLFKSLKDIAIYAIPGVEVQFKISSIFPRNIALPYTYYVNGFEVRAEIVNPFLNIQSNLDVNVEFYYSLYSLKTSFRKRWLPKAISPDIVGRAFSGKPYGLRLHHALIGGENDTLEDVKLIHNWLEKFDITTMVNIVRYNPYSSKLGSESSDQTRAEYIEEMLKSPRVTLVQEIPRVGTDVYASCGVFIN